jgi:hypothetical protein
MIARDRAEAMGLRCAMRLFTALAVAACVLGTMPAHGVTRSPATAPASARVTGTYVVTSVGKSEVLGVFDTAGSATWSFDAKPSQRLLPATLTQAAYGPYSYPCTESGGGMVTESVAAPGADPGAGFDFAIIADLLRGRTRATLRLLPDSGYARKATDQECTGAVDNGVTTQDVDAAGMFPNGTVGYDPWPMKLDSSGHWHIDGVQTESGGAGNGSSRAEVHAVLTGTLKELRAACTVPTVKQLHRVKSFKQGIALVIKAGFGKPHTGVVHIAWTPKGHYYVDEIGDTELMPCGARLHLYRS